MKRHTLDVGPIGPQTRKGTPETMARIISTLNSILRPERDDVVHFHASSYEDRPEVCYDHSCSRPRLSA